MDRNIGVERTYKISDFNLLKLKDEINNIPVDEVDQNLFTNVAYMQLVSIELVSVMYAKLTHSVNKFKDIDELIKFLEEEKDKSLEGVKLLLQTKFKGE